MLTPLPLARPLHRSWTAVALVLAVAAAPLPALAAPDAASKSQQLATQAKKAYDDGQFDRAFDLYLAALRAEPGTVAYLYAAARAAHQAGKLDRAEETYLQALKAPDLAADLRDRCTAYLDAIATTRSEARAQEAESLQKAGKYAQAAGVWREAAALQPSRGIYFCRAGRASRLADDPAAALRDYAACRDKARPDTADHAEALRVLKELETAAVSAAAPLPAPKVEAPPPKPAAAPPSVPAPAPAATVVAPAPAPASWPAWVALGGGAALVAAGAGLVAWAGQDEAALNARIDATTAGKVTQISYADAKAEHAGINQRYAVGWSAVGLGAAAVGLGAWLQWRDVGATRTVAVLPASGGVRVAVRF